MPIKKAKLNVDTIQTKNMSKNKKDKNTKYNHTTKEVRKQQLHGLQQGVG